MSGLACDLLLDEQPDGDRRVGFRVRNEGSEPAELRWFEPFVAFQLEADIDGAPVRVLAGPFDGGVQPVQAVLAASEERVIATPVTLAFDTGPALPNPGPPSRWRIAHAPAETRLLATVQLGDERLTCEAELS